MNPDAGAQCIDSRTPLLYCFRRCIVVLQTRRKASRASNRMSGELTNLIAILGVGIALATLMFAMFRIQDRKIDLRFHAVDQRFHAVDQRFDAVNQRFDEVDRRFDEVDRRFEAVDRRFEILEARVDRLVEDVAEVKGSLATLHAGLRISVAEPPE